MPRGRGGLIEVDLVKRSAGAVQEILPAQRLALFGGVRVAVANGLVELDRVTPPIRVVVANPPPARVSMKRASYCEYPVTIVWRARHHAWVDPVCTAREFVAARFPEALAAFLGGSAGTALRTPTSDLDVVVVLDGPPAPFRETLDHEGWLVEVFAHTRESFAAFVEREIAARRSPLLHMCGHGEVLLDRDGTGQRMGDDSRARLRAGPAPLSVEELENHRYLISDLLDDLTGCQDPDELVFIANRLLTAVAELVLLLRCRWLGNGKWLLRRLRETELETCESLVSGYRHLVTRGDATTFCHVAETVINRAGGRLMQGYRRGGSTAPNGS
ncbi:nucleotidyltransferase domain-containing protein [Saccharopolyspora spinosa]|uniref:nucleotidyltransferase domain-containing protein n=1 Tax=Saccharopolyspora spinosa TaxID=60894 RepID=UPI001ED9460D|nr:nucleotidyltransferase domain-containing protein [Saccharopolyspora spinosa]